MGRNTTWERVKRILWGAVAILALGVIVWALGVMCGCGAVPDFRSLGAGGPVGSGPPLLTAEAVTDLVGKASDRAAHDTFAGFIRTIAWASRLLALASIAALVASFWVPLIPRATAAKCFALSVGLAFAVYGLTRWGSLVAGVMFWAVVAAAIATGVVVAWPYVVALRNRALHKEGAKLAVFHPREGAALQIAAKPVRYRGDDARKALVKQHEQHSKGPGERKHAWARQIARRR